MTEQTKHKYHTIICEAWDLFKQNMETRNDDLTVARMQELSKKYKDTNEYAFAADLFIAVTQEITRLEVAEMEGKNE